MDDPEDLARRFVVGYHYLLLFRRRSPAPGAASIPPPDVARLQAAVGLLRRSELVPAAECVTVEAILESLDDQPPDVRAVLIRLLEESDRLRADPKLLLEAATLRRRRYPGVLEGRTPDVEP
jgi:hypothetical protein